MSNIVPNNIDGRYVVIDVQNSRQRLQEIIDKQFGYAFDVSFDQALTALLSGTEYITSDHVEADVYQRIVFD